MSQNQNQLVTVEFHGQSILAILHDGKPYVAMQPICENVGLQWGSQYNRIQRNPVLKSTIFITKMVAEDGKQREMICLPLTMLNGWLFGVDVNRVKPELRPKLMVYQRECFDVLFNHFMPKPAEGRPYNPAIDYERISPAQAQDIKELVQMIVDADVQGYGETYSRLHRKFRVNSYLELPATKYDEVCMYLRAKLPKTYTPAPDLLDDVDVPALLLSGQCAPMQLTPAVQCLIDQHTGRLIGEAYPLIRAHLERRVAWNTNQAQRQSNDTQTVQQVLSAATLGNCLAHHYRTELQAAQTLMQVVRQRLDMALGSISQPLGLIH